MSQRVPWSGTVLGSDTMELKSTLSGDSTQLVRYPPYVTRNRIRGSALRFLTYYVLLCNAHSMFVMVKKVYREDNFPGISFLNLIKERKAKTDGGGFYFSIFLYQEHL